MIFLEVELNFFNMCTFIVVVLSCKDRILLSHKVFNFKIFNTTKCTKFSTFFDVLFYLLFIAFNYQIVQI